MDFFDFIFYLKTFKINKKLQKARRSHAGGTWHARPRGRVITCYIYIIKYDFS